VSDKIAFGKIATVVERYEVTICGWMFSTTFDWAKNRISWVTE